MRCECGHLNPDGAILCSRCHAVLPTEEDSWIEVGQTVRDQYRIDAVIGEGAMGQVFRAWDLSANETVALKVLHPSLTTDKKARTRMKREAAALRRIRHPNVVAIHDVFEHERAIALALEFVHGGSLADLLARGPASLETALPLILGVLDGLQAVHDAGVTHRDVKPANILMTVNGVPKIADFGIARDRMAQTLTATGASLGTPGYMSPEQIVGETVGPPTDVYAAGVLLFELLTGTLPFCGRTDFEIYQAQIDTSPDYSRLSAVAPQAVVEVVARALSKEPSERWPSAAHFADALRRAHPARHRDSLPEPPRFRQRASGPSLLRDRGSAVPPPLPVTPSRPPQVHSSYQHAPGGPHPEPPWRRQANAGESNARRPAAIESTASEPIAKPREPSVSLAPPVDRAAKSGHSGPFLIVALVALVIVALASLGWIVAVSTNWGPGSLHVELLDDSGSPIHDAKVSVDGVLRCRRTPCDVNELEPTAHVVTVVAAGYQRPAPWAVAIESNETALVELWLVRERSKDPPPETSDNSNDEKERGLLRLLEGENANGARVLLHDGMQWRSIYRLPINVSMEFDRSFQVAATKPGYQRFTRWGTLTREHPDLTISVHLTPEESEAPAPPPARQTTGSPQAPEPPQAPGPSDSRPDSDAGRGTLAINSVPVSFVLVDGRPVGRTPTQVVVSPGNHTVVFVHEEKGRRVVSAQVSAGERGVVAVRF